MAAYILSEAIIKKGMQKGEEGIRLSASVRLVRHP